MLPLQFPLDTVVCLLLLAVPFVVVFGVVRLLLPRAVERLVDAGNWSANGESVVRVRAGVGGDPRRARGGVARRPRPPPDRSVVLVLGGRVIGVAVERRRRTRATPQTELPAVAAGLLAVGVMVLVGPDPLVAAAGLYLAAAFGGIARAAAVSVVSRDPVGARADD